MELDSKQKVLLAIYAEYQKDLPDMAKNITAQKYVLIYRCSEWQLLNSKMKD